MLENRHKQEKIKQQILSIAFKLITNTKFDTLRGDLVQFYRTFSQVLYQLLKKRQTLTQNFKQPNRRNMLHFGIKLITIHRRIVLTEQHSTTKSIKRVPDRFIKACSVMKKEDRLHNLRAEFIRHTDDSFY